MTRPGSQTPPRDEQLDAMAAALAPFAREPTRVEKTRNVLLANAQAELAPASTSQLRWKVVATAAVLSTLAAAGWWLSSSKGERSEPVAVRTTAPPVRARPGEPVKTQPSQQPAVVNAVSGTRFERTVVDGMQAVRFDHGTINVTVFGQRVRVAVADAKAEATDARFEVRAKKQRLLAVVVFAGRVEVSAYGRRAEIISAGQTWTAAKTHASSDPQTAPKNVDSGRAFRAGWALLSTGKADDAAATFDRVCRSAGHALGEDACFWAGVSHKRAKQNNRARRAFARYLRKYPHSARAGEASALLGWLLMDANEFDLARKNFEAAAKDSVPNVRRSGKSGLRALEKARDQ